MIINRKYLYSTPDIIKIFDLIQKSGNLNLMLPCLMVIHPEQTLGRFGRFPKPSRDVTDL